MAIIDPGRKQYAPIGRCIYCDSTEGLSREHIVPYSLGGRWVLQQASCTTFANITRDIEADVAQKMLGTMRAQFGFPTRRKKKRKRTVPFSIHRNGGRNDIFVPINESPTSPVALPILPTPLILSNIEPIVSPTEIELQIWSIAPSGEQKERFHKILGPTGGSVSVEMQFPFRSFFRLLAKIAHASAVAEFGIDSFTPMLRPHILGTAKANISHVVGGWTKIQQATPEMQWAVEPGIYDCKDRRYLTIKIEPFRLFQCPCYWVVVSEASDALVLKVLKRDPRAQ
jgi:hypothetical protein